MSLVMTLGVVFAVFCFDAAVGQEGYLGHDHEKWHHGFYQTLERPDTKSPCCNLTDCRPTSGRQVDGHYEVKVNGAWVSVPAGKILKQSAPDLGFHVCSPFKFDGQPDHLSFPKIASGLDSRGEAESSHDWGAMLAILHSLGMFFVDLFKSPCRLEAENLFLRHQLSIALRRTRPHVRLRGKDWLSATIGAVVSSIPGAEGAPRSCPAGLMAEVGLRWCGVGRRFNRTEDLDVKLSKEALRSAIRSRWCSKGPGARSAATRPPFRSGLD
jgi:hypothetical protein